MPSKLYIPILAAVLLSACGKPTPPPEDVVADRAMARWEALINNDLEATYPYQTPGYREQTTAVEHVVGLSRRLVSWTWAELREVRCQERRCELDFMVGYRADGAPGVLQGLESEGPVTQVWIQIDGQWWYSEGE